MPVSLVMLKALGMRRRVIIALLVFALSGWTQAFALSDSHGARPVAPAKATHSHSCCPKLHGSYLHPMVVPALPASLPCGEQHSCCFGRDSNNPVTLTATPRVEGESRIASFAGNETGAERGFALARVRSSDAPHSYSKLSTILRN